MADKKISELTELTTPDGTEELVVNDSGVSKKITQTNLLSTALPLAGGTMTGNITIPTGNKVAFDTDGATYISEDIDERLRFWVANTEFMRLTNDTTDEIRLLPYGGNLYSGGNLDVTGSVTCDGFTSTGIDDNATSTAITINATKNVGIGVVPKTWSSNADALQVGDQSAVWIYDDGSNPEQSHFSENVYSDASSTEKYIETDFASDYYHRSGVHNFRVAPSGTADTAISWTTALTIENNGNVAIDSFSTTGASDGVTIKPGASRIVSSSNTAAFSYHNRFYNTNGQVGYISTDTSATYFVTSSDYRLKENVVPMSGSIDRLKALNPSRFNFITSPLTTVDGFIAHEAQVVVPESVHGIKDAMKDEEYEVTPAVMDGETVVTEAVMGTRSVPDYQGIDQSKLVPLLVASLQEAVAKIEALEARVTALEV